MSYHDLRYALRTLRRRPAFALVAILALAFGIGVNTAVFSIVDAVLLRSLPAVESDRLVMSVRTFLDRGGHYGPRYDDFVTWRDGSHSFESFTAVRGRTFVAVDGERVDRIEGSEVTPSYFATLGVRPALGRVFTDDDLQAGDRVVLVSHAFWQRRLGGDEGVVGRGLTLDGESYTVIGVMPDASRVPTLGWKNLWTPLAAPRVAVAEQRWNLVILARLKDGVSVAAAQRDLDAIAARRAAEAPATHKNLGVEMHPVRWWIFGDVQRPLILISAVSALVLLIACGTVSNLTLSRLAELRREMAVRKALGAPRRRLVAQMLTESVVLALAGGSLGLLLALAGTRLLLPLAPTDLPRIQDVSLNPRVIATMLAASLVVGVASGLAPALTLLKTSPLSLRGGPHGSSVGGRRFRQALVAIETALALLAVIGAGLLVRSMAELRDVDPGFEANGLLTLRFDPPEIPRGASGREAMAGRIASSHQLLDRVEALPGVTRAAVSGTGVPMRSGMSTFELYLEGHPKGPRPDVVVSAQEISAGYLEALGIELMAGRSFASGETWETANAVLVNQTMARRYWPGEDPIGRWVEWQSGDRGTVVGVVADVRQLRLHLDPAAEVYNAMGAARDRQTLVVRTDMANPEELVAAIRREIHAQVPGVPVYGVATGDELLRESYADRRLWTLLLSLFAVLAVGLGFLGFYGVVAHSVAQRTREIGIRMALGAWPSAVVRLVVSQGLRPVLVGLAAGVLVALELTRWLESQLYGVTARDPLTFVIGAGVIVLVALVVCVLPARRAVQVEPGYALRSE